MKINLKDVEFQAFSGSGPGGQKRNKCQCCIRAIHEPTGLRAVSTSEKSQTANKKEAIRILQEKLDKLVADKKEKQSKIDRDSKPEASFGSQIRTYRLVGSNQVATDHRSGATMNVHEVLDGNLDPFLLNGDKK